MKTTIHITNLFDARKDKKLMRVLFSLTLRGVSSMRNHMHHATDQQAKDYYKIIIIKLNKKIVGWSQMYQWKDHPAKWTAHFYVARAFRRRGIGTILYNKAKQLCGDMCCSSWDKVSASFFIKNKAKLYGEKWQDTTSLNPMDIYLD